MIMTSTDKLLQERGSGALGRDGDLGEKRVPVKAPQTNRLIEKDGGDAGRQTRVRAYSLVAVKMF